MLAPSEGLKMGRTATKAYSGMLPYGKALRLITALLCAPVFIGFPSLPIYVCTITERG